MSASLKRVSVGYRDSEPAIARAPRERLSDERFLSALGVEVRSARETLGLTRKTLAETAGISERYLAQLESGTGNASIKLLRQVAAALNMRLTSLLAFDLSAERGRVNDFVASLPERRLGDVMGCLVREFGSEESVRRKRIALIGMRGAGKTTLGTALAKSMRRPFIELDREIELEAGVALSEIFMLYGPAAYRKHERQCLERLISSQVNVVMSVGGGVVAEQASYELLLKNCYTVWVKASPTEHMSRVIAQGDLRPMRGRKQAMDDLKALLKARESLYARADVVIDTSGQNVSKSLAALSAAVSRKS